MCVCVGGGGGVGVGGGGGLEGVRVGSESEQRGKEAIEVRGQKHGTNRED